MQELLKTIEGLDPAQAAAILEAMKTNKLFTASEENLDVRYGKLQGEHTTKTQELTAANELIAQLKKDGGASEGLQQKVTDYEATVAKLTQQLTQERTDAALRLALLEAHASPDDIDYLAFKAKEGGEIALNEDGSLKDKDALVKSLQTAHPRHFEQQAGGKKIEENKLPPGQERGGTVSQEDFTKMGYKARAELFKKDPDAYARLTGKTTNNEE